MDQQPALPRPLRIVAAIQLVGGILAAVGILVRLTQSQLPLDLGLLGIPIYFGLLRLSSGWRTCALVFLWIGMITAIFMFAAGAAVSQPTYLRIFGIGLGSIEPWWAALAAIPLFLLLLWQYRVLVRPDVRSLFDQARARVTG